MTGTVKTCEACAKAKAVAKGVTKTPSKSAEAPGERLYFDTSRPNYWFMEVDDATWYKYRLRKAEVGYR
jgi:hypothetical protein